LDLKKQAFLRLFPYYFSCLQFYLLLQFTKVRTYTWIQIFECFFNCCYGISLFWNANIW